MTGVRAWAAIAVWAPVMALVSACANDEAVPLPVVAAPQVAAAVPRPFPVGPEGSPERVRADLVRWFQRAGYQSFQIEALAEHAKIESGFRPCASGAGLRYTFQWGGLRLQRLRDFAGTGGACPPLDKQLAFADSELRNEPTYSCFWHAQTKAAAVTALRRGFGRGSC